jgi:hypothetical protein
MKPELPGQLLEKYSNSKFHENLSSRSGVVPCKRKKDFKITRQRLSTT